MKIDFFSRYELRAFRQSLAGQLRFERVQTIYVVGKKNDEMEITAGVREAHSRESVVLRITEILISFSHHRDVNRCATVNMKRLRLRCVLGKWIGPGRF